MEKIEIFADGRKALGVFDETYAEELREAVPTLNESNIRFIAGHYKKLKRCPTYGELRILGEVLERARLSSEGILISGLGTDSIALIETYKDMLDKAEAIIGKRPHSLTLGEAAEVMGEYMRMIGRYDSRSFISPVTSARDGECCLICDGSAVMTLGKTAKGRRRKRRTEPKYALFLVENDEKGRELLTLRSVRRGCRSIIKVTDSGLIGLIAEHCDGLCINTGVLCEDAPVHSLLTECYKGDYVAFVEYARIKEFRENALRREVAVRHFADANKSGIIKGRGLSLPLELVRRLADSRREAPSFVSEVDVTATCRSLPISMRRADGEEVDVSDRLVLRRGRLLSAFSISPDRNSFALSLNSYVEAILRLVAAGVDRRAICSAAVYELPEKDISYESLGESLGMILGVYRAGVELAVSEGLTEVRYKDGRSLSGVLYASAPRRPLSAEFTGAGNFVGFLPLEIGEDGMVDFVSLRRICDRFTALCLAGRVYSARAVVSEPSAVITEMSHRVTAELTDNGQIIANTPCRGILFETELSDIDEIIGRTVEPSAEKGMDNNR